MSTTLVSTENIADTFSRIAIAIQPGGNARVGSSTNDWNRDPSWLWPPPLYQPYCKLHFLKECSLYHLQENENFKRMIEARILIVKKPERWHAEPTRVQPARRAREKNRKDHSGASVSSRTSSPLREDKPNELPSAFETCFQQLQLHLSWPVFKTKVEGRIEEMSKKLSLEKKRDYDHISQPNSYFTYGLGVECRYCRFNPEVVDCQGSALRRLVPPAPMHSIQMGDMREEQVSEFGGLTFAVDVSGEQEMIVLLGMQRFQDLANNGTRGFTEEELVEKSDSTKSCRSRKRSVSVSQAESNEVASRTPRKRRTKK
ncbi:hypothetical protein F4804DRAFT_349104 [Jackrogersella minutella]|nr:hypothetical protein F4804DRAFT_349104 [Jackrogersella minutella]